MDASCTELGDETGVALAEAIKQNQTLKSVSVDAFRTEMGDDTAVALAKVIEQCMARTEAFSARIGFFFSWLHLMPACVSVASGTLLFDAWFWNSLCPLNASLVD